MKKILFAVLSAILLVTSCVTEYGYRKKGGCIVYNTPQRPAGQQSMLGFSCDPIENVRIGFVGLGMRGGAMLHCFMHVEGATIAALCDLYPDRVEKGQKLLTDNGMAPAAGYSGEEGYKALCEREDIDLVYIAVPWQLHTPIAVYAMQHGKHVAIEVPAATSVAQCWDLVNTAERTRRHCMMMENCCYDDFEITTLNMAQQGLFGEIVHAEGAYCHNLDPFWDLYQGDWRMLYNREHHGDVYPTHGIGPLCQALNIHRGDRMDLLVAMETDAFRGRKLSQKRYGSDNYANGDNTCTLIRTRKGKTILVEHSTATPRPYDRMYQLQGTKGLASKYPVEGYAVGAPDGNIEGMEWLDAENFCTLKDQEALKEKYRHPILTDALVRKSKEVGGHGGMDFIMSQRLIYCLNHGLPLDQDVYDAAEWSCLVELSETSIRNGCMSVVMPDFTRGEWDKVDGLNLAK